MAPPLASAYGAAPVGKMSDFSSIADSPFRATFYLILATVFCQTVLKMACLCALTLSLHITAE